METRHRRGTDWKTREKTAIVLDSPEPASSSSIASSIIHVEPSFGERLNVRDEKRKAKRSIPPALLSLLIKRDSLDVLNTGSETRGNRNELSICSLSKRDTLHFFQSITIHSCFPALLVFGPANHS